MTTTLEKLTERVSLDARIDPQARILRGVVVLKASAQGGRREYSQRALEDVVRLVPGVRSFEDHAKPDQVRPMKQFLGSFLDAELASDTVRASFRYVAERASIFEQLATDAPRNIGFSVSLLGQTRREGGKEIVDSVADLQSIDLVSSTGATTSLWESAPGEPEISDAQMLAALGVTGGLLDAYEAPLGQRPQGKPVSPVATTNPEPREPTDADVLAALR